MAKRGNKGEWSELYALLKLLSLGRLYTADEQLNRISDVYYPIQRILREEASLGQVEYVLKAETGDVDIFIKSVLKRTLSREWIKRAGSYIYTEILSGTNRAFEIDLAPEIMENMYLESPVSSYNDKKDIRLLLHDIHTGLNTDCGFSIISQVGSPATLLNASGATNFIFQISGISDLEMEKINRIDTSTKILDRIKAIRSSGTMKFVGVKNRTFASNLMLIDRDMEEIIAEMLTDYYLSKAGTCRSLTEHIERRNPLGYPRNGLYEYKFKRFLSSIALGMTPAKEWNGNEEANGGFVIIKQDGEVLAYHLYNRNSFETFLLDNTKFEKGSTTKHGFATVYKNGNNEKFINLNLQIRFI